MIIDISSSPICLVEEICFDNFNGKINRLRTNDENNLVFIIGSLNSRAYSVSGGNFLESYFLNSQYDHTEDYAYSRKDVNQQKSSEDKKYNPYIARSNSGYRCTRNEYKIDAPSDIRFFDCSSIYYDAKTDLFWGAYRNEIRAFNITKNIISHVLPTIGCAERFECEMNGSLIYANIPEKNIVVVVDRLKHDYFKSFKLPENHFSNYGLALDEKHCRLFIATQYPSKLIVMNSNDGSIVTNLPCSIGINELFYDELLGIIFVVCGEGYIHCFKQLIDSAGMDTYVDVGRVKTCVGARASVWLKEKRQLYIATPKTHDSKCYRLLVFEVNLNAIDDLIF